LKNSNKPFGEGTSRVKKTPQVQSIIRIFIGTVSIDIPIAEVMMTSYSEEGLAPKTPKMKFFKLLASSTPTRVPRPLQVVEATPARGPTKGRRILPPYHKAEVT